MPSRLRQGFRFDGLWWRQFAYLGCVYGPEWWKRCSPPVVAAIIFALVGRNRRGAIVYPIVILAALGSSWICETRVEPFDKGGQNVGDTELLSNVSRLAAA